MEKSFYEQPKEEKKEDGGKEKERREGEKEPLFEVKKSLMGFDVLVGINRGEEPITGKIDFINKGIELRITPEGVKKGLGVVNEFLNNPQQIEKLRSFNNKWEQWLNEKRKKNAEKTVNRYAQQEGKTEAEVVKEFLDGLEKKEKE